MLTIIFLERYCEDHLDGMREPASMDAVSGVDDGEADSP